MAGAVSNPVGESGNAERPSATRSIVRYSPGNSSAKACSTESFSGMTGMKIVERVFYAYATVYIVTVSAELLRRYIVRRRREAVDDLEMRIVDKIMADDPFVCLDIAMQIAARVGESVRQAMAAGKISSRQIFDMEIDYEHVFTDEKETE
jgi:hypothetical protein